MILITVTMIPTIPTTMPNIISSFRFYFPHMYHLRKYGKFSKCTHFGERRTAYRFGSTHLYNTIYLALLQLPIVYFTHFHNIFSWPLLQYSRFIVIFIIIQIGSFRYRFPKRYPRYLNPLFTITPGISHGFFCSISHLHVFFTSRIPSLSERIPSNTSG